MAHHQVDRALDEMDAAMGQLRRAIRGIPARREGFVASHRKLTTAVGRLTVNLSECRSVIKT
jgi:hypothetical protein